MINFLRNHFTNDTLLRFHLLAGMAAVLILAGCQSAAQHREAADRSAAAIIAETQEKGLGRSEPFSVERPSDTFRRKLLLQQALPQAGSASLGSDELEPTAHWPDTGEPRQQAEAFLPGGTPATGGPIRINLVDALQLGAANARDYQARKESLFSTALNLDLQRFRFDNTYRGALEAAFRSNQETDRDTASAGARLGVQRTLETGADLTGGLVIDLVRLLGSGGSSSYGIRADGSITVPLMRGSGRHVVTEPRTQAERDVLYALFDFERFKKSFAVNVANDYFSVLQQRDRIANAEASLERLKLLVERTEALHAKGRVTGIQLDQGRQDLLEARQSLIAAQQAYQRQLDAFKVSLGLPADSRIELAAEEFNILMDEADAMVGRGTSAADDERGRGRYEIAEDRAILLALANRLDLRVAFMGVEDAQRRVAVAADALRAGLNLVGNATSGDRLDPDNGIYSLGLAADAPWSRRSERVAFRRSLLQVEAAVRAAQQLEDSVKLDVRNSLSNLLQQREQYHIQAQALRIAERRVRQAQAFQEVGRAETRDVLEANNALTRAQNSVVDALVSYRISELRFQRDLGLLQVDERGIWNEFNPEGDTSGSY